MPPESEPEATIVDYSRDYGDAFERLNVEWLEKYFELEPIDKEILADPERHILDQGGVILYACLGSEAVGTVALKHDCAGVFELTKMAVTETCQGLGLGRQLLCAAIDRFRQMAGKTLYLESNSALTPALTLYESAGFEHASRTSPSDYQRSDVYMVYRGDHAPTS
ncbi:MAG: GNAT family N-acetyltransferase [Gammaproteobacteria bacterium]|nr:GNAT family N-acetyltransferase [Gammaproteobacteria bacterium]NNC58024.1 GNAT family N-acetyltransferase [Woeseiaceae bacterium]